VSGGSAQAVMAAGCTAMAVSVLGRRLLHPRRDPAVRMQLYLGPARSVLDGGPSVANRSAAVAGEALRRVLGPLVGGAASRATRALGLTLGTDVEVTLRQAGLDLSAENYRREYLRWLLLTPLTLGAVGVMTGRALWVGLFFLAGLLAGGRRAPERLRALVKKRCERIRGELPAVMSVLALKIENNKSLMVALSEVVAQGSGPVVDDLGRALNLVNAGYGDAAAFELLATQTAEPAAVRFYRLIAVAMGGGIDVAGNLLDQANQIRAQRREEVERTAAKRQMALIIPNLVFMAPVLFAFLLAPLPQLMFGR
jgi:tight adherence protein C